MRGFTIIEILISSAILIILAGLGLFVGLDFYKSYAFHAEKNIVISLLQKARSQALNNINESEHGIYLENNRYTIFQGPNYASRNPAYDEVIQANALVANSGLREVVFRQLTALPSVTGNIILNDGVRSSTIFIENEGRINWQ